ncbi:hypothetical protein ELE36_00850 [Pseudolysobacter antarcticus]|uniref:Uncharacterized protein n=1 Tax=Pseudolysobacter antarcticus TaxID=2511995 RepID=A0A411HF20_9GAMM|nr:hypothetical protein [Pseudolysobacter antarcticus]QBB69044.1 hypothetical protein ELE36_00850 [Pseudolysobacter antarcticus]
MTSEPARAMQATYDFIGQPAFKHDFDRVEYNVTEFDRCAGTPGLHTVRGKVHAETRETLLPPDLFQPSPTLRPGAIRSACPRTCASFEVSA